jgi:hypothetical protein
MPRGGGVFGLRFASVPRAEHRREEAERDEELERDQTFRPIDRT